MQRRDFLFSAAAGWLLPRQPGRREDPSGHPFDSSLDLYARLVRANDAQIPALLEGQERRPGIRGSGGIPDGYGIPSAGATAHFIKSLACAYAAPESSYAGSGDLVAPMEDAARFLRRVQHADGTIDLHTTNFHSPPDTAFVVEPLAAATAVLQAQAATAHAALREELDRFLLAAGEALIRGGIHTPNHRWVVCAALARLHALHPSERYVRRIDEWLAEGIDIDEDGQFTERSTAVYSPVTDHMLLTVSTILQRPSLLDPVRRNLEMTLYYAHPDGDVATEGSRRQDQYARGSMAGYYLPYRRLAIREGDGRFAAMARLIEEKAGERLTGNLVYFLEDPLLRRDLPASEPLPTDYARLFPRSHLARIRRSDVSATILAGNPVFLSFRKGSAVLEGLRLAAAFFGKGQFSGLSLSARDNRYALALHLTGPYYQPLPPSARRPDGDWNRMDRSQRPLSEVQELRMSVEIEENAGAFAVAFEIDGCDHVPLCLELGFRRGGELSGVTPLPGIPDAFLLESGTGRYRRGQDVIEFGPGQADHRWTQIRGALPKLDALSVYVTGYTPFRRTLRISGTRS